MLYLKKIEVYGFKSFADKLELKFDQPITAIVGPNGCGKSNVSDAIRWVLGEQNPKNLRGKLMQDLIFNGTDARKSMSYCEVSLFLDNTTRLFPIQMDEVIISRKLYRNNESEYMLNRNIVRLKDILDLLRNVGLGRESFSIVGQGRMDAILNARPEDRRAIFESALGISNFRVKKRETENKLEKTKLNMDNLAVVSSELEKRIGPLRKDAINAQKYLDLRDQLRYHEINSYIYAYDNASKDKADARAKLDGLKEEYDRKTFECEAINEKYDQLLHNITDMESALGELREKQLRLSVNIEKREGDKNLVNERIKHCRQDIVATDKRIEQLNAQIAELQQRISDNNHAFADRDNDLNSMENECQALTDKFAQLTQKANQSSEQAEHLQKRLTDTLHEISLYNGKQSGYSTETQTLSERYQAISDQLARLKEKLDSLSDDEKQLLERYDVNKSAKIELEQSIQQLQKQLKQKEFELFDNNKRLTSQQQAVAGEQGSLALLKDFADNYKGYQSSVQSLMHDAKSNKELSSRICGVVANLLRVEPEYQLAIETALGARLQNIVTENEEDAKYIIKYMKTNVYGRVVLLPISSMKPRDIEARNVLQENGVCGIARDIVRFDAKYRKIFDSILGGILVVDNIDNAVAISKKYGYVHRIVTLAGERINNDGSLEGGSKKSNNASLLSYETQIEQRTERLKKAEEALREAEQAHNAVHTEADTLRSSLTETQNKLQQLNVDIATDKEKIETSYTLNNSDKQNILALQAEQDSITDRLNAIKKESEDTVNKLQQLHETEQQLHTKIETNKTVAQTNAASKDAMQETLSSKRLRVGMLRTNMDTIKKEIAADSSALAEAQDTLQQSVAHKEQMQQAMDVLCTQLDLDSANDQSQNELKAIMDKINSADLTKAQLNEDFHNAGEQRMQLTGEVESLRSSIDKQEYILAHIDENLQELQERVYQEYNVTYSAAMQYKDENYDHTQSKQTINDLRVQMQKLGNVNVNAIEEIKQVEERFGDIGSQMEDLRKAESDLKDILRDLTNEIETRFESGMEKINENFKVVFRKLFNGGNAKLSLDRGDETKDSLDYGIDIEAQPPGKKLQNISLLSGGERTLTAAAILFAIMKLHPMPFCVLDEIEAALDDANADRIARYMRSFSNDTQFLVITHKKPTMENSDVLYGVTMEEKGVSRIVSVKLNEAIQQAQ